MSTIRDLLQVILEEEIKHQQVLGQYQQVQAQLADLQTKYDALKAECGKCNGTVKS